MTWKGGWDKVMGYDWTKVDPASIKTVSWPPSRPVSTVREETDFDLETLDALPAAQLREGLDVLQPALRSAVVDARFEVRGDGRLLCVLECDVSLPVSERIDAASVLWRSVDERLARLWRIGELSRASYPEFMRQRRDLVRRLPMELRTLWMCVSLVRLEPLLAASTARVSVASRLIDLLDHGSPLRFVEETRATIEALPAALSPPAGLSMRAGEAAGRVVRRAREGFDTRAINAMAAVTEEVFTVLLLIDGERVHSAGKSMARQEDRTWWQDIEDLLGSGVDARERLAERAVGQATNLASCLGVS